MRHWLLVVLAVLLAAPPADAGVRRYRFEHTETRTPSIPIPQFIVADLEAELPSNGVREGDLAYTKDSDKFLKRTGAAWVEVAGGGGGAPTGAQYWTGAADGTLTNEHNLGALGTGVVLNTAGTPSAYAGTSCTAQFPRSLNASGVATCAKVVLTGGISDVTGILPPANGGTGQSTPTDDRILIGDGANWLQVTVPDCDADTEVLQYRQSDNTWLCGDDDTGAGGGGDVEAEVDFGANGNTTASVTVTGQTWVSATSKIVCAPTLFATADRDDGDEDALVENLTVAIHSRVASTGFTVMAHPAQGVAYGKFKVHCTGSGS